MHDFVDIGEFLLSKNSKKQIFTLSTLEYGVVLHIVEFEIQWILMEINFSSQQMPTKKGLLSKLDVFWCFWGPV